MKLNKIMLAIVAISVPGGAFAHGYMETPPSRDFLCHVDSKVLYPGKQNIDCGQAQFEPQSNGEFNDGFPAKGPQDGKLASGHWWGGTALDVQTAGRWQKTIMQSGPQEFTWRIKAQHPDKDFKYYITKEGWNPNEPLNRGALEKFCEVPGSNSRQETFTHTCNVPERTGYHVIYGAWDVGDTAATFYKAVDVEFEDRYEGAWTDVVGTINQQTDLQPGSQVMARVFDKSGERPDLSVTIDINSTEEGLAKNWSHALATKINEQSDKVRAGQRGLDDTFTPNYGSNVIYTKAGSGIVNVIADPKPAEEGAAGTLAINGLQGEYLIDEQNQIAFSIELAVERKLALQGTIYNADNDIVATFAGQQEDNTQSYAIALKDAKPGKYTMVVIGTNEKGQIIQENAEFRLRGAVGDYEFAYPDGVGSYKKGTRVLQPENSKIYECKVAGWCNQAATVDAYVPGTGWASADAWAEK